MNLQKEKESFLARSEYQILGVHQNFKNHHFQQILMKFRIQLPRIVFIVREAKRRELLLHVYGIKKQPPKIFKNGRIKFFQRQKFFIFHAELNSNVNRPDPARPGPNAL